MIKFKFLTVLLSLVIITSFGFTSCDKDEPEEGKGNGELTINGTTYSFSVCQYSRIGDDIAGELLGSDMKSEMGIWIEDQFIDANGSLTGIFVTWYHNGILMEGEHDNDQGYNITIEFNSNQSITLTFNNTSLEGDNGEIINIDGTITLQFAGA